MSIQLLLALFGAAMYLTGFILYVVFRKKGMQNRYILSYLVLGIGWVVFSVFSFLFMRKIYANDKVILAMFASLFLSFGLLFIGCYPIAKDGPKWLQPVLLAGTFLMLVAMFICMVALSQDAIINGINVSSESSSLL